MWTRCRILRPFLRKPVACYRVFACSHCSHFRPLRYRKLQKLVLFFPKALAKSQLIVARYSTNTNLVRKISCQRLTECNPRSPIASRSSGKCRPRPLKPSRKSGKCCPRPPMRPRSSGKCRPRPLTRPRSLESCNPSLLIRPRSSGKCHPRPPTASRQLKLAAFIQWIRIFVRRALA